MQAHSNCKANLEQIHEKKKNLKKEGKKEHIPMENNWLTKIDRNRSYKKQWKYKTKWTNKQNNMKVVLLSPKIPVVILNVNRWSYQSKARECRIKERERERPNFMLHTGDSLQV